MNKVPGFSKIFLIILTVSILYSCRKPTPPVITTTEVTEISYTTAMSGGNVTDIGGASVVTRGICWNTSGDATIDNSKTVEAGGIGTFTSNLTQLTPNTTYYAKAYAINSAGTGYGDEVSFTTLQVTVPVLTTEAITSITTTTAVSGGNITSDNGGSVTERGVCWSTETNPTITHSKTSDGSGTGAYISSLTGLSPGTNYYVRAYATNSAGTEYGTQLSFTTLADLPLVTTNNITSITATTAIGGGNITSDGGATITARGVCWSTSSNPTVTLTTKTTETGTTGTFTTEMTGLNSNTTYYVKAYSTNSIGTAYGAEVSFTTKHGIGESYQGGIIAYILQSGDPDYVEGETHGLIAAPSDQGNYPAWYNGSNVITGATGTALGTGNTNTNTIVTVQGNIGGYAARLCYALELGGYNDWYLPSKDELSLLYMQKAIIGGFQQSYYWSSSESSASEAWSLHFGSGQTPSIRAKSYTGSVRAVRSF